MARKTQRAALTLEEEEKARLGKLAGSHTAPAREVTRARILLAYAGGGSLSGIARDLGVSRPTVYKCVDKALAAGAEAGLRDVPRPGREPEIGEAGKAWVVGLACRKPKDLGMSAELWTQSALAGYVRGHAAEAGHPRLAGAGKSTVWRILNERELKPHRVRYYLERRDPDFDLRMAEVLMVYRDVSLRAPGDAPGGGAVYTVSVDEKPGARAVGSRAPDLPPVPGRHAAVGRDREYVRHGTLSILAALDLHTGEIIANAGERHRSAEFVALLRRLDARYPKDATIRVVLDNHASHTSRETMGYLAGRPGRFEYVHTPKHGSWLNLVEVAFSRMARTFPGHIRVRSLDELRRRILLGIEEMNASPVPYRWTKFDGLMSERL